MMDHILGQETATTSLQSALDSGRVHHAWIFHGPVGVGKFTTALAFAQVLLDPEATPDLAGHQRSEPDGPVGQLVRTEQHPDLHIIRKELALYSESARLRQRKLSNIPVDLLRERVIGGDVDGRMHDAVAYRTARQGHGKVFIIEEAELLDTTGQNAMLKTLEEPPPQTYFILLSTQEDRLLPTIRSRCQRVAFTPLPDGAMQRWVERSGFETTGAESAWIREIAGGSPGTAMMAKEDGLHGWYEQLRPSLREIEQGRYPPGMGEMLASFVDQFATGWVKRFDNASKEMANQAGMQRVFMILGAYLRQRLAGSVASIDEAERWLHMMELLYETEGHLSNNINLKIALENLVVQWTQCCARRPVAMA